MIERGDVKVFRDIFEFFPITAIIELLNTNHKTLSKNIVNVDNIRVSQIRIMADYFGTSYQAFFNIIVNQMTEKKKLAIKSKSVTTGSSMTIK